MKIKVKVWDPHFDKFIIPESLNFYDESYGISRDTLEKQLGKLPDEEWMDEQGFDSSHDDWFNIPSGQEDWMQFTGLLDKHGKEIFEGDWVKYEYCDNGVSTTKRIAEVVFNDGMFMLGKGGKSLKPVQTSYNYGHDKYEITHEIIGNVHQNPELLDNH